MITNIINKIKSSPKDPGVYIFYRGQKPLYIGKASNLKNRLQNYLKITDLKTAALHREATSLKIIPLHSNIEALIAESGLIKELKPKYNILWRDDKSYFYVFFTNNLFPKIIVGHKIPRGIKNQESRIMAEKTKKHHNSLFAIPNSQQIGPFTDGRAIKAVLRILRRYFPYCTCQPHFRFCLNSQINNCPGYCCKTDAKLSRRKVGIPTSLSNIKNSASGQITSKSTNDANIKKYRGNIQKIKNILTGKDKKFLHKLKDPYELLVLEKIWAHEPYLESGIKNLEYSNGDKSPHSKFQTLNSNKVECYDNSHFSGKEAVGAMTVWTKQTTDDNKQQITTWIADKNMWRKFKIQGNYTEDDPRMMEEIVSRRLNHPEWPYPDLMIIDGGITQLRAAQRALHNQQQITNNKKLQIISFAKPQQFVFGLEKNPVPISKLPAEFQNLIKTAIQNTHNFVIRYHRKIRKSEFLKK